VERGRGIGLVWERFRMGEDGLHWTSLDILDGLRRGMVEPWVANFTLIIRILIANALLNVDRMKDIRNVDLDC